MSTYLPRILLTGANGQIGMALRHHPRSAEVKLMPCSHTELDITDTSSILHAIAAFSPDIIINTAAYTAVDKAEQEREQVLRINHAGAENLAQACKKNAVPLIHLSTDYIFDGQQEAPYKEHEKANPVNTYGLSKWLGEEAIRTQYEQHIILRVSGIFSEYGNNFLKTILRLAQEKKELRIVADQITCPTYAGDIADLLFSIVQQLPRFGTYHYCNAAPLSWHQFATCIIQIAKEHQDILVEEVKSITTSEYPTLAQRPAYSVLDCSKIEKEMGLTQKKWNKALAAIIPQLLRN
jgi:dTDP-4-dehydrorhamnose reductase